MKDQNKMICKSVEVHLGRYFELCKRRMGQMVHLQILSLRLKVNLRT